MLFPWAHVLERTGGSYWDTSTPADWNPPVATLIQGLGLVPRSICAPHFNRIFSGRWGERGALPDGYGIIGIDEQTALVSVRDRWEALGRGSVTILRPDLETVRHMAGDLVELDELLCWNCPPP